MAILELQVAVWTLDTYTGQEFASRVFKMDTTLDQRMGLLREAVEAAGKWFRRPDGPSAHLNVFLAPEYLFVKAPDARALTMGEADTIECSIRDLSKGMLLIPGTVVWKKPVDRGQDQYEKDSERGARALERRTAGHYKVSRHEKALAAVETDLKSRLVISELEKNFVDRDLAHEAAKTKTQALASLESLSLVRNTAYGYHDRTRVLKYHKRGDFTEVLAKDASGGSRAVFIPGAADGYFEVNVNGLTVPCGIEICGDHQTGYLSNASLDRTPLLHFITSAATFPVEKHIRVHASGYMVHASSRPEVSGVFSPAYERLKPNKEIEAGAGLVLCFDLALEV
jgi:hypothetical protein